MLALNRIINHDLEKSDVLVQSKVEQFAKVDNSLDFVAVIWLASLLEYRQNIEESKEVYCIRVCFVLFLK